jgi:hypothetical protein
MLKWQVGGIFGTEPIVFAEPTGEPIGCGDEADLAELVVEAVKARRDKERLSQKEVDRLATIERLDQVFWPYVKQEHASLGVSEKQWDHYKDLYKYIDDAWGLGRKETRVPTPQLLCAWLTDAWSKGATPAELRRRVNSVSKVVCALCDPTVDTITRATLDKLCNSQPSNEKDD